MKNVARLIGASALAALALSACSRSELVPYSIPTHSVKFVTESPETKTTVSIEGSVATFSWTDGDIARLNVWEDGIKGTIDTERSKIEDRLLTLFASFPGEAPAGQKTYTAILNGSVGDQTLAENSYDEAADILIAKPVEAESTAEGILFQFRRPVAVNKMTLYGLPEGQTLKAVTVSSNKYLTGTIKGEDWDEEAFGKNLTLTVNRAIPESGEITVYYTSVPAEEAVLTVRAEVGTDIYKKTFGRGLTTTAGDVRGYSVDLVKQAQLKVKEDFNSTNASTDKYGCQSKLSTAGNSDGFDFVWTPAEEGSKAYVFKNGIRLGTGDAPGKVQNSTMLIGIPAGKELTVKVYAACWDSDGGDIVLGYNGQSEAKAPSNTAIESPNDKTYDASQFQTATSFTITKAADVNTFTISSSAKRIIIDKVEISFGMDEGGQAPSATAITSKASDISQMGAVLSGSYTAATSDAVETYFQWGTSAGSLTNRLDADDVDGSLTATLTGLSGSTTYYYQACVKVRGTGSHILETGIFSGEVKSFTTATPQSYTTTGWLELPAAYDKAAMSGTTSSSLNQLIQMTHKVESATKTERNYTFLYDPEMYAAYWVAYPLAQGHMGSIARPTKFPKDPYVEEDKQTDIKSSAYGCSCPTPNYPNNYYARGHQLPNADRNGNAEMQNQAFYATNITPQLQNGFNGGVWEHLEQAVRDAVPESDSLYVVTGAAFQKKGFSETIAEIKNSNDEKILPVPNYYWKVILKVKRSGDDITEAKAIGFWLPHTDLKDADYVTYVTTVDQIEAWTGFDFFANLPGTLQTTAEANADWTAFCGF